MKMKKIFATCVMVLVMATVTKVQFSAIKPQDPVRGPAVSSPAVEIAPNGDRVSHYPPYFHPDH
ncbi:hypothetical protein [Desulforhabdus sp. TSK]|uniref:hypothetical protein n=1 Tax=Desulforhabdus sp. TSK TaxID=2925014 RepID=UPI001FC8CFC8|nr:hypothetical protein [Desulforhabdus sp. TSK]GKT07623.1 hypothetical protein DSTSK_09280 [Desulforhabdus sp. TSK]